MPGVSGSVMAICFGVYERLIKGLSSFKNFISDIKFLSCLGIGIVIAVVLGSKGIKYLLVEHYIETLMFFIGMMIPGVLSLFKEIHSKEIDTKKIISIVLLFLILTSLSILTPKGVPLDDVTYLHTFISLFLCGLLDAASTIIPGISGSALLMLVGYYEKIISALANPFGYIGTLIPFLIGLLIGIVLISKIINYLFSQHRVWSYLMIIVFSSFSIMSLLNNALEFTGPSSILWSFVFLGLGFGVSFILDKKLNFK